MGNELGGASGVREEVSRIYSLGSTLGTGAFAVVKRATRREDGKQFAIKIIKKSELKETALANIHDEVDIMLKIDHPNCVKLYQMFETDRRLILVEELIGGGDLFSQLRDGAYVFSENEAALVAYRVADALKYLHAKGIVHRDLKPENLLCVTKKDKTDVKITDFGEAKYLSDPVNMKMISSHGSPSYVAPEILLQKEYTCNVDIWSLGVIIYVLLSGSHPFDGQGNRAKLYQLIKQGYYTMNDPVWQTISIEAKDLIAKCLTKDPNQRISAAGVMEHPWCKSAWAKVQPRRRSWGMDSKIGRIDSPFDLSVHDRSADSSPGAITSREITPIQNWATRRISVKHALSPTDGEARSASLSASASSSPGESRAESAEPVVSVSHDSLPRFSQRKSKGHQGLFNMLHRRSSKHLLGNPNQLGRDVGMENPKVKRSKSAEDIRYVDKRLDASRSKGSQTPDDKAGSVTPPNAAAPARPAITDMPLQYTVKISNLDGVTTIVLEGPDCRGILAATTAALSLRGADLSSAVISTRKGRVKNTYRVSKNKKMLTPAEFQEVAETLLKAARAPMRAQLKAAREVNAAVQGINRGNSKAPDLKINPRLPTKPESKVDRVHRISPKMAFEPMPGISVVPHHTSLQPESQQQHQEQQQQQQQQQQHRSASAPALSTQ
eukprot:gb/GEZN01002126.1/.p1 GENE.gb/GEZN01002126.1/~~gb/GEZN01002126.1/.p1  ORF type:complete len:666 (-),score=78.57 gb/GEZN01002126.1/:528-2525(-)